jgi:phosphoethanolamine N-methyltransferase
MGDRPGHVDEYDDAMVAMLELVWGEGFLAPGGADTVRRIVRGLELRDRHVLDIGCGVGGGDLVLAGEFGARVTAVDLEAPLIARAEAYAKRAGLDDRIEFYRVDAGHIMFTDDAFDVVYSCGAFTQIEDKAFMFDEVIRVLKPGGAFAVYDWMKGSDPYSDDMRHWFKMEGLTYAMQTPQAHEALLGRAGFTDIVVEEDGGWYGREAHREYERMQGALQASMLAALGAEKQAHFLENWRAMLVVLDKGELRPAYFHAMKPAA